MEQGLKEFAAGVEQLVDKLVRESHACILPSLASVDMLLAPSFAAMKVMYISVPHPTCSLTLSAYHCVKSRAVLLMPACFSRMQTGDGV